MRTKNTRQGYVRFRETSLAAFICVLAILLTSTVNAQVYKLSNYDMKILGSSNVHDWTMKGKNVTCCVVLVNGRRINKTRKNNVLRNPQLSRQVLQGFHRRPAADQHQTHLVGLPTGNGSTLSIACTIAQERRD